MGRVRRGRSSVFRSILDQQYDESSKYKLYRSVKGSQDWVQRLGLLKILPVHSGCVNCICWNEKGDSLLSGSDDQHLVISHAYNYKVLTNFKTSHKANIFSAKFLPCTGDTGIVSCSGDGMILYSDLARLGETQNNIFNCHVGTTYEVQTIPNDPYVFLSCGEDTTVRSFDLRMKEKCIKTRCMDVCNEDVLISCQRAVTALTVNTVAPYQIAIGCSDSTVRLYDRRMLSRRAGNLANPVMSYKAPGMEGRSYRITSLSFSPHGEDILASYSSEHLYLFGVKNGETTTLTPEVTPPEPAMDTESLPGPVRRLRLRGDWSDTGPDARPQNYPPPVDLQEKKSNHSAENDQGLRLPRLNRQGIGGASQARPTLHGTLMQRMTDVLSRMLNDPATRAALSHGGEAFAESDPSSQVDPPPHGGSEGEEGDEDTASNEQNVPRPGPLDLPLPSFSSSFTQSTPEDDDHSDHMDVEDQSPEDTPTPKPEATADAEVPEKSEETPSTSSSSTTATASTSTSNNNPGISPLNELSNMYHGFVEKTGVEPMVNLTYSDVGSTASCISVFVKRDKSTETTSQERVNESDVSPSSESQGSQQSQEASDEEPNISQPEVEQSPEPEPPAAEEEPLDSDNEVAPGITCRLIHPIGFHMEDAIKNMTNTSSDKEEEPSNTRKSYFKQKYVGHRNARTMIKEATFWGDEYVVSGSDCGHVFMWQKESGKLEMLLEADHHVVNCVQPHPFLPILATSGIDYDVKLWAPVHNEPAFEQEIADELMKRNAVMLEETKDTITVPASFMIRMLACLNQLRRGGRSRQQRRDSNTNSD